MSTCKVVLGALGAKMTTNIFAKSCSVRNSIVWERSLSARWALKSTYVYVLVTANVKVGPQFS
jgi:hypothetical protein